ncbi:MAG: anti-sigma factor [Thiotrichales bacterium]|nr:anti-sigma factor [Thiotrichales bacterium]
MKLNHPTLKQRLADDYVFGLMSDASRRNFEKRLSNDSELKQALRNSEALWNQLVLAIPETPPSKQVWLKIAERLQLTPTKVHEITQMRQNLGNLPSEPQRRTPKWLVSWAIAASISTFGLGTYLGVQLQMLTPSTTQTDSSRTLAVLVGEAKQAAWLVELDAQQQQLRVNTLNVAALDTTQTYELWLLSEQLAQPLSLGLLPEQGFYQKNLDTEQIALLQNAQQLAVTVEPAGGSPTGQPTQNPTFFGQIRQVN